MARYQYCGTGPCRVGGTDVNHGDIVESDTNPGRRFTLIPERPADEPRPRHRRTAVAEEAQTEQQ